MTTALRVRAYGVGAVMVVLVAWPFTWARAPRQLPAVELPDVLVPPAAGRSAVVGRRPDAVGRDQASVVAADQRRKRDDARVRRRSSTRSTAATVAADELCNEVAQRLEGNARSRRRRGARRHRAVGCRRLSPGWPHARGAHGPRPVRGAVVTAFERWYLRDASATAAGRHPHPRGRVRHDLHRGAGARPVGLRRLLGQPLPSGGRQRVAGLARCPPASGTRSSLLTVPLCIVFMIGWRYKVTAPITAVVLLFTTTYHDSFGQLFHTENLMVHLRDRARDRARRGRALARPAPCRVPRHRGAGRRAAVRMARCPALRAVRRHLHARRVGEDLERRMGLDARRGAAQPDRVRQRAQGGDGRPVLGDRRVPRPPRMDLLARSRSPRSSSSSARRSRSSRRSGATLG